MAHNKQKVQYLDSEKRKQKYSMKPAFEERMRKLLPDKDDFKAFEKIIHEKPRRFIRCNTLKIKCEELVKRLLKKGWDVEQPFLSQGHAEVIVINSKLLPGELGEFEISKSLH